VHAAVLSNVPQKLTEDEKTLVWEGITINICVRMVGCVRLVGSYDEERETISLGFALCSLRLKGIVLLWYAWDVFNSRTVFYLCFAQGKFFDA
jgi:hypothetical protein